MAWTEEQKNMAYAMWRFKRWTEWNKTYTEIDNEFDNGQHHEDFVNFLKNEMADDLEKSGDVRI